MAKRRQPEDPEKAAERRKRFLELKPEVRAIYIDKKHHAAIKAFAKTLKTGEPYGS